MRKKNQNFQKSGFDGPWQPWHDAFDHIRWLGSLAGLIGHVFYVFAITYPYVSIRIHTHPYAKIQKCPKNCPKGSNILEKYGEAWNGGSGAWNMLENDFHTSSRSKNSNAIPGRKKIVSEIDAISFGDSLGPVGDTLTEKRKEIHWVGMFLTCLLTRSKPVYVSFG